jgi:hypothetical protein
MQDKYVADIGDFGKYHFLRWLSEFGKKRIGIVWCYSSGDTQQNNDGKHVRYLGLIPDGDRYVDAPKLRDRDIEEIDPDLFGRLRAIVLEERRSVDAIESDLATYFGSEPIYVRDELPIRSGDRDKWKSAAIEKIKPCEILFLDPDNGLSKADGGSKKHLTHNELKAFWGDGLRTLVLYHHPSRSESHDKQLDELATAIQGSCLHSQVFHLRYRRGTSRAYFVIVPNRDADEWEKRLRNFLENWRKSRCGKPHSTSWTEYGKVNIPSFKDRNTLAQSRQLMPCLENLEEVARLRRHHWPQIPPWRPCYPDDAHLALIRYVIHSERLVKVYYAGLADERVIDTAAASSDDVQIVVRDQLSYWGFDGCDEMNEHDLDWARYYASKVTWKRHVLFQSSGPFLVADLLITEIEQMAEVLCGDVLAKVVILVGAAGKFRNESHYHYTEVSGLVIGRLNCGESHLTEDARMIWAMYFPDE